MRGTAIEGNAGALCAPFPYFGGKRRVAAEVWRRFGDVRSYVEPFFGSGAVLLGRPTQFSGVETVNDADGLLCNFWRAVQADPDGVAHHADWPVNECDLHARHLWLVERRENITERLCSDPEWFDVRAAGWWVWGMCAWIGHGWCSGDGPWLRGTDGLLERGDAGRGINRQMPRLGNAGQGINSGAGAVDVRGWMRDLSTRLRRVRVCAGDWSRVTSDTVTWRLGLCGVFLDPPYDTGSMDYAAGGMGRGISSTVRAWAIEAGERADMRIALCGYDEHDELAAHGWAPYRWKTAGGYGAGLGNEADANRHREVVWFSPHCLGDRQPGLFDAVGGDA